jgi:hypothetical protein
MYELNAIENRQHVRLRYRDGGRYIFGFID